MKKKSVETHKNNIKTKDTANMDQRAEKLQRKNAEKYQNILKNIHDGFFELDLAGNFTFFNDSVCRILGYSRNELMGMNYRNYTDKENAKKISKAYLKVYNTGKPSKGFSQQITRKDGAKRYIETSVSLQKDSSGKPTGFIGIVNDITERKKAEDALRQEQQFSKLVLASLPGIFYLYTYPENRLMLWNKQVETLLGFNAEEIKGRLVTEWFPPEKREAALKAIVEGMEKGQNLIEAPLMTKDGHQIPFLLTGVRFEEHDQSYFMGIGTDISESKQAEDALRESEEKYRSILEGMDDVYFEVDIKGIITFVNPSSCKMSGYSDNELIGMSFKKINAPNGIEMVMKYFGEIFLTDKPGKPFLWNLVKKNGEQGFFELIASLIRDKQGKPIGFRGIGRDITERKRTEEKLHQTLSSLRNAVGVTIQVLVSAIESRDSYTAGHQSRSADLACAIAKEMGLAPDKIEGIRMAGSIHDIGKLSIPAEILSKPTKLTNLEFSLIKEHSRSGYEMLKGVQSPWPLAEIVYQHHERLNGTGYPRNLKGDEILLESRLLAVADVVEAMASHRPYRPTLGIEAAIEEIEKNKGILYDNDVADACLRLFREKGYKLK